MNISKILSGLKGVRSRGKDSWLALCPVHTDSHPSLSIDVRDGRVLMKCHGCCATTGEVISRLAVDWNDLFSEDKTPAKRGKAVSEKRHEIYEMFLDALYLYEEDKEHLMNRGLSEQTIADNQYRSLRFGDAIHAIDVIRNYFNDDDVISTPGFVQRGKRIVPTEQNGILIPVRGLDGQIQALKIRMPDKYPGPKYKWFSSPDNSSGCPVHVPYAIEKWSSVIIVTEGPLKADVCVEHDNYYNTIAVGGHSNWKQVMPVLKQIPQVKEVHLAFDMDWNEKDSVRKSVQDFGDALKEAGYTIKLETWNPEYKGIDDALLAGAAIHVNGEEDAEPEPEPDYQIEPEEEQREEEKDIVLPFGTGEEHFYRTVVTRGDEVEPKRVEWILDGWIPKGCISLLDGNPGVGKSLFTCHLASLLTTEEKQDVIFIAGEDSKEFQVVPRLQAAKADLSKIHFFEGVYEDDRETISPFSMPYHLDYLKSLIRETGASLVILDPIMSHIDSSVSYNNDQQIRRLFHHVNTLCFSTGVAVLGVRHLNKRSGTSSIYRGIGSIGLVGASRSCLLIDSHPEDIKGLVLAHVKCNVGPLQASQELTIETSGKVPTMRMLGEIEYTADDLLDRKRTTNNSKIEDAADLILDSLASGRLEANAVQQDVGERGVSEATYRRARKHLQNKNQVRNYKENGRWFLEIVK